MSDATLPGQGPVIIGVLNLTPDSFSDGGAYTDPARALEQALRMAAEGAAIIDVGGESTRPGAGSIAAAEQIRRVLPVVRALRFALSKPVRISIDTRSAEVAAAAIEAGATMLNDVSAGRDDPDLLGLAAASDLPIVLMHMQGTPETMQSDPRYQDVVAEVRSFLLARAEAAQRAGVKPERIILDPGIGFGKTQAHNIALLAQLQRLVDTGYPVLLGASRKRFMGSICAESAPAVLVGATCATTALGVAAGVRYFRVHDVQPNRQAAEVAWAIRHSGHAV
ncbi:MAG: dihydropteroate synthase [Gammaproteobacteria bacterium]